MFIDGLVDFYQIWYTTRPAPRFMWPTSELPICPTGNPTARPEASNRLFGYVEYRERTNGTLAASMADTLGFCGIPQPSRIISMTFLFINF
jgi:hypothetical protein